MSLPIELEELKDYPSDNKRCRWNSPRQHGLPRFQKGGKTRATRTTWFVLLVFSVLMQWLADRASSERAVSAVKSDSHSYEYLEDAELASRGHHARNSFTTSYSSFLSCHLLSASLPFCWHLLTRFSHQHILSGSSRYR